MSLQAFTQGRAAFLEVSTKISQKEAVAVNEASEIETCPSLHERVLGPPVTVHAHSPVVRRSGRL